MTKTRPESSFHIVTEDIALSGTYVHCGVHEIIQLEKIDENQWLIETVKAKK
ncbi:MAG: hypothetical protein QM221_04785 [Bacillota bacterium]|nr:hypothetical protein [Bacillota bacterium]